jgi:transposase-like protein
MADIGRPSGYKPEYAKIAKKLCRLGATRKEIAEFFEVGETTIFRWIAEHRAFRTALKVGKAYADKRVTESLYHRAVGYSHDAVKILQVVRTAVVKVNGRDEVVHERVIHKEPYVEHVPPDTVACIFWLKNRRPDEWRDVHKIEKTVKHLDVGSRETLDPQLQRALEKRTRSTVQ